MDWLWIQKKMTDILN
jgi:hypothetical protein